MPASLNAASITKLTSHVLLGWSLGLRVEGLGFTVGFRAEAGSGSAQFGVQRSRLSGAGV